MALKAFFYLLPTREVFC